MKTRNYFIAAILLFAFLFPTGIVYPLSQSRSASVIAPALRARLNTMSAQEKINVIVILSEQANVKGNRGNSRGERLRNLITILQNTSDRTQSNLRGILARAKAKGNVDSYTPLWIVNAIALSANQSVIDTLANQPEVQSIVLDSTIPGPPQVNAMLSSNPPEQNLSVVNAPALWNLGYQGQGVVVASMDTGVDYTHPDLNAQWRGGSNSWYDPYNQHPTTPTDVNGHGTWTMGVMVGRDAGGTSVGMAPQAQWIAVKMFNDSNVATTSAIHLGYQWLLDPDHNASTNDAPDVVNNSWTNSNPGCDLTFEPDLQALVAAGITPVFAAGNSGPASSTSLSPANNPDAFAVGATDNNDAIYTYSSRGPTSCGQPSTTYPAVVAPGVNIRTTDLFGSYFYATGTSLAAPHVTGAIALLLNAFPSLSVTDLRNALTASARDLGTVGPDNTFGNGRIDVLAAHNLIASGSIPTSTPVPTSLPTNTLTPTSTFTSTPLPTFTFTPLATFTATSTSTNTSTPPPTSTFTSTPLPTATKTATPSIDNIFADGFESGNFSAWTSTSGGARLSVTSNAAMVGSVGMQSVISGNTPSYVEDETPANENSYHARFYFNPNSTATGGAATNILIGLNTSGTIIFRVQYRKNGSNYQVRAGALNNGSQSYTSWYTVSNAAHPFEIAWQSGAGSSFSLYIDGTVKQTLINLNTGSYRLDRVRMGPSGGLSSSVSGTEYFDAFVSTRTSYIGP